MQWPIFSTILWKFNTDKPSNIVNEKTATGKNKHSSTLKCNYIREYGVDLVVSLTQPDKTFLEPNKPYLDQWPEKN